MKMLKNGEQVEVGDKVYRVIDDELFEIRSYDISKETFFFLQGSSVCNGRTIFPEIMTSANGQ